MEIFLGTGISILCDFLKLGYVILASIFAYFTVPSIVQALLTFKHCVHEDEHLDSNHPTVIAIRAIKLRHFTLLLLLNVLIYIPVDVYSQPIADFLMSVLFWVFLLLTLIVTLVRVWLKKLQR